MPRNLERSDPAYTSPGVDHLCFYSEALSGRGEVTVWSPPGVERETALPVVFLLHGVFGTHWSWMMQGGAHQTLARLIEAGEVPPMALATPSDGLVHQGTGYVSGTRVDAEAWIMREVPQALEEVFPFLSAESPRFLGGLSMGGFGALRLGAKYPEFYRAISAHSAVESFATLQKVIQDPPHLAEGLGEDEGSVLHWMVANKEALPPIRFDCGTEDLLIKLNRKLHAALENDEVPHTYEEFPGAHDWIYWRDNVERSFRFFASHLA